jgi:hypothetical protein
MPLNSVKGYWIEMLFSATVQLKGSGDAGKCSSGEMLGNAQIVSDTSPER